MDSKGFEMPARRGGKTAAFKAGEAYGLLRAAEMADAKAGAESDAHTAKELRALAGDYRTLAAEKG